jgi:pyruvoyl-dependent arginine decarboxylase (PvlArgDC)
VEPLDLLRVYGISQMTLVRMWSILPPCFLLQVKEQVANLRPSGRVAKTLLFYYNIYYRQVLDL